MTLSWIVPGLATALALLGAQKPEWGAGTYPDVWKEARLEADRAGRLLLGLDMSLVVLTDTCEMLCCFLIFCSSLWLGSPKVTPISAS